jgi:hypothetical protein
MIENIDNIRKELQEYVEVKLNLLKLHTAEHLSRLLSYGAIMVITGYLLFLILLFISFAAGFFLGSILHSNEAGFLCIAGFYFLVLIGFLRFRKQIVERPVIKAVVKFLFPKFDDDENKQ